MEPKKSVNVPLDCHQTELLEAVPMLVHRPANRPLNGWPEDKAVLTIRSPSF